MCVAIPFILWSLLNLQNRKKSFSDFCSPLIISGLKVQKEQQTNKKIRFSEVRQRFRRNISRSKAGCLGSGLIKIILVIVRLPGSCVILTNPLVHDIRSTWTGNVLWLQKYEPSGLRTLRPQGIENLGWNGNKFGGERSKKKVV